ncbi:hypothetical protein HMPREF9151_01665 [Hoylesella saccharolytica F0055]|uniref:Uncharacterized protein n=1 Tax=Hoylesella saccharolytica F0055 TaxID=1127699 RepID=L1N8P5_9BACT|nr:hypothetical protein [Hoylesella saccharolytica]EKX99576.1 hypothetical protein HMPREF9151_01665 [Hoylesella saccharolytica F0055]
MADINKLTWYYRKESILLITGLMLIAFIVMNVWLLDRILTPLIISVIFSVLVENIDILIWKRVAMRSPESLPTFFMGVSGFRMLLGVIVMFIYYLVAEQETMLSFFLVFVIFYVTLLIHHTLFFVRINKKNTVKAINDKKS